jgi:hypothetical protein
MVKFLFGIQNRTPFIDLLIFATIELQIPEDELLELEFFVFEWVLESHNQEYERHDARFANLMCLLANVNRGKNSKPFKPTDFMPRKPKSENELQQEILSSFGLKKPNG